MAHFNLRYFLETLGNLRGNAVFLLEIGAMDGARFDPVHEFVMRFGWNAVMVEPLPEPFARLQATYAAHPAIRCVQTAIAGHHGETTMFRVRESAIIEGKVPAWGYGTSSLYSDRNALAFDDVRPHIETITVPCTTLPRLLDSCQLSAIDVLQIDTEGHDYHVLKQLDFSRFKPLVINMEAVNLPKDELGKAKQLLDEQGYLHAKGGYDLLAVHLDFFKLLS